MTRIIPGSFDGADANDPYNLEVAVDWIEKAIAGTLTGTAKISTASLTEDLDLTGDVVLGDASTDTLTVNSTSSFLAPVSQAVSYATTTGALRSMVITQTQTVLATANQLEALKVEIVSNVKTGQWANAIFGKINYGATGLAHGNAAVICSEIAMPSTGGTVVRGSYYNYSAEVNCPTGLTLGGNPMAIMAINTWGGAEAQFDDYGFLFDITGVTAGEEHFYDTTASGGTADGTIKIRVGGTTKYLLFADDNN